ncbi:glycosyltransferase family 4 protein [Aeribacillus sp. FSL K6-2848]|uniref:glycosyltransferase family 4 protein n=1 Tax=unclassified Aeribacillus TaxID=2640495 RepID=UPI0030D00F9D
MRIHLIANMYPSKIAPNYGVFVKNTEEILVGAGFNVDKTVLLKEKNRLIKLVKYFFYFSKIILKGLTKKYDITYVHYASHNALPILFLKLFKKDLVIFTNVHGSDVVPEVPSQKKYQPYVDKLLNISNIVITPSKYYQDLVRSKYNLRNRIEVFPSGGVNSKTFYKREDKQTALKELMLDIDTHYIGYVSRLDVGKGWDILLTSLKKLKDENFLLKNKIKVIMVGDGKDKERFVKMVSDYELNDVIIHYPLLPQEKLNAIYNAIDVFCFPTTRKGESLGLVGLEAMACGAPVIGSAIGGLLDYIIDGENGLLFQAGSSEDLYKKIKFFYSMPENERRTMSYKAIFKANEYKVENIKHKLINIFLSFRGGTLYEEG